MKNLEIYSFLSFGYEGRVVKVEADLKNGLPITEIVGLPGNAVKEARERVRVAIKNSGFEYPALRIVINLSPASEKKDGSGFDLPIALSILRNHQKLEAQTKKTVMVIGELELSGRVRKVSGVLAAISSGLHSGINYFIVPTENKNEASIPGNCEVFGADNLEEAFDWLKTICESSGRTGCTVQTVNTCKKAFENSALKNYKILWSENITDDFCEVKGQEELLYALELAAVGGHNLLAYGPPGCGKSLALKKFSSLLPDLDFKTSEEVTRIYSIAGLLNLNVAENGNVLIKRPPFRAPHASASLEGIVGGAGKCLPGEISLAHGGVLFLDEAVQFKMAVLQSLRTPLETGVVVLSRAEKRTFYPARFQLLMAMNPCQCGNLGSENKFCTCSPAMIDRYWKKLTAPLLDRIDLRIFVRSPSTEELLNEGTTSTKEMRSRIKSVYENILERNNFYCKKENLEFADLKNANLKAQAVNRVCILTREAKSCFKNLSGKNSFSGRGSHTILKIARTTADLEGLEKINTSALEKAIALRKFNPMLPDFL